MAAFPSYDTSYAQGGAPVEAGADPTVHGAIIARPGTKCWNPPGWRGRYMWDGNVTAHTRQDGKTLDLPNIVFVGAYSEYQKHQRDRLENAASGPVVTAPGWKDASEIPAALRENILDYYGSDLTPAMRMICAEQIAARASKSTSRPAAKAATPRRAPKPRAGAAPRKTVRRRTR